jgi:hypothetical protein
MSNKDILRIFQAREHARSSSTPVDLDLAKESVTQRFALRTDTPAARARQADVSPFQAHHGGRFEDLLCQQTYWS